MAERIPEQPIPQSGVYNSEKSIPNKQAAYLIRARCTGFRKGLSQAPVIVMDYIRQSRYSDPYVQALLGSKYRDRTSGNEVVGHELRKKGQLLGSACTCCREQDGTYKSNGALTETAKLFINKEQRGQLSYEATFYPKENNAVQTHDDAYPLYETNVVGRRDEDQTNNEKGKATIACLTDQVYNNSPRILAITRNKDVENKVAEDDEALISDVPACSEDQGLWLGDMNIRSSIDVWHQSAKHVAEIHKQEYISIITISLLT
ncbi:8150_t:CDS:2 [Paraglomus brasilianum]|uniref:8150_t:CDS:1 n=1 Tax=Paraglomus brasilianum TaxID=144538 RepID=A0A9N9AZB9_9GLOM|nr:8150_t:CDS:2 [Paraglomus brasilianum]